MHLSHCVYECVVYVCVFEFACMYWNFCILCLSVWVYVGVCGCVFEVFESSCMCFSL